MSDFHDPDLRQELGRLSGPYPDDNAAFAAWQRRIGQVRRRRVVAWATIAALSLVVGTVAVAAVQSPGRNTIVPGKSADTSAAVTVSIASTEAEAEESSTVPEAIQPETSEATTLALETAPTVGRHRRHPRPRRRWQQAPRPMVLPPRETAAHRRHRARGIASADTNLHLGRRHHHGAPGRGSSDRDRQESGARLQSQGEQPLGPQGRGDLRIRRPQVGDHGEGVGRRDGSRRQRERRR